MISSQSNDGGTKWSPEEAAVVEAYLYALNDDVPGQAEASVHENAPHEPLLASVLGLYQRLDAAIRNLATSSSASHGGA